MKKRLVILILALLSLFAAACAEQAAKGGTDVMNTSLRLLTANIWGDYFGNPVSMRENQFIEAFDKYQPDVIGMQECTVNWHKSKLFDALQEKYVMVSAFDNVSTNYVPLFFRKDRFELLDSDFHYYTQTPDDSKAYTCAVLKDTGTGQVFAVFNTHFWWKSGGEHDAIRMLNAQELVAGMERIHQEYACPVFGFGDLNCSAYAGPFQYFTEHNIVRLRDIASTFSKKSSHHGDPKLGKDKQYHGSLPKNPEVKSLDHIIGLRGTVPYDVLTYQVILDQNVLDASDHSPVYADIVLYSSPAQ